MKTLRLLVLVVLASTASCSSWLAQAEANPQAAVSQISTIVSAVVETAQIIFGEIQPSLPADAAAADQAKLTAAIAVLEHSMTVLEDALETAIEAKDGSLNISTLEANVQNAIDGVVAIIDDIRGVSSSDAGAASASKFVAATASAYQDLKLQQGLVRRVH